MLAKSAQIPWTYYDNAGKAWLSDALTNLSEHTCDMDM